MTISSAAVFEVRVGGSDTNGGGWVTGSSASGGTDWSQQTAAQYSVTDGVTAGSTVITSATAGFGTDVVGNIIYVQGGTGAVSSGWYQILSRTSSTTIVVDRLTGLTAGTGTTLKIGGAFASPGTAAGVMTVAGMTTFIKYSSTPFTISSTTNNVSGGCVSGTDATVYSGYDTTRSVYNTDANRPTIKLSSAIGSATTIFTNLNALYYLQSVIVDGSSVSGSICAQMSGEYFYVKSVAGVSGGLRQNLSQARAILCEATTCSASPLSPQSAYYCYVHDNTLTSPTNTAAIVSAYVYNCISANNNCDGFAVGSGGAIVNSVAYNNAQTGINILNSNVGAIVNCISESNSSAGFRCNTGSMTLLNCASFGNGVSRTVSATGKVLIDLNPIIGTGSFFTSSTNYTLNNTAGAGAACRAIGFPSSWPSPSMSNFADIGALQSSNTGGGTATAIYGVMGS